MAAALVLLRLKLRLLGNTMQSSVWVVLGTVFIGLYGLGAVVASLSVLIFTAGPDAEGVATQVVLWGSALSLIWLILPLFFSEALMDPKQFITYGIQRRTLLIGLTLSGAVSVLGVLTALWLVGLVFAWRSAIVSTVVAALSIPVALAVLALIHQATATFTAAWMSGKRSRDTMAILAIMVAVLAFPIMQGTVAAFETVQEFADELAFWLGFSPLGAVYVLPRDVVEADWLSLLVRLAVLVATCAVALLVIRAGMARITEKPSVASGSNKAKKTAAPGLFGFFPKTPTGAVAARQLTYWVKDPRYGGSLAIVPVLILLAVFMHWQTGADFMLYIIPVLVAWMIAFSASGDISYDHTAFSLHVTTGVSGLADRTGRAIAVLTLGVPGVLICGIAALVVLDNPMTVLAVVALSFSVLFSILGLAVVFSARAVYPVPKPGESPFKQPQGAGGRVMIVQTVALLVSLVLMIPDIVVLVVYLVTGSGLWLGVYVALALIKGLAVLWGGIRMGARIYDARLPEIFQKVNAQ